MKLEQKVALQKAELSLEEMISWTVTLQDMLKRRAILGPATDELVTGAIEKAKNRKEQMSQILVALCFTVMVFTGCTVAERTHVYRPSQFETRLDWLRFCQHYYVQRTDVCRDD